MGASTAGVVKKMKCKPVMSTIQVIPYEHVSMARYKDRARRRHQEGPALQGLEGSSTGSSKDKVQTYCDNSDDPALQWYWY